MVANSANKTLAVYRADPTTGALTLVPGCLFSTGDSVSDIAFLSNGRGGYATMPDRNIIEGFQLDPANCPLSAANTMWGQFREQGQCRRGGTKADGPVDLSEGLPLGYGYRRPPIGKRCCAG